MLAMDPNMILTLMSLLLCHMQVLQFTWTVRLSYYLLLDSFCNSFCIITCFRNCCIGSLWDELLKVVVDESVFC